MAIALNLNKLMLNEDKDLNIAEKMTNDNVLTFYSLAKQYKLATVSKSSLLCIERCFSIIIKTQNFLHLDFNLVAKVLASSELNIQTEVEIFNAVINWIKHNIEERSKYAKQLLLKVRFTLLSKPALKFISNFDSTFSKKGEFVKLIKQVTVNKKSLLQKNLSSIHTNRYCSSV